MLLITKSGEKLIQEIDSVASLIQQNLRVGITDEEFESVTYLLKKIADGFRQPPGIRRPHESAYRVKQRRVKRSLKLLGDDVFGSGMSSLA